MSFLDSLTINQKDILVSLPYRAGLWISQSDETGGDEADEQELQVLSNILDGFADEVFGSEVVQYIMSETVSRKDQWSVWAEQSSSLLSDCEIAIGVLSEHTDEKDVHAFQNHVLEIGQAVALAFREYDHAAASIRATMSLSYFIGKLKALITNTPYVPDQEFFNISQKERKALNELAKAMGTTYA